MRLEENLKSVNRHIMQVQSGNFAVEAPPMNALTEPI